MKEIIFMLSCRNSTLLSDWAVFLDVVAIAGTVYVPLKMLLSILKDIKILKKKD